LTGELRKTEIDWRVTQKWKRLASYANGNNWRVTQTNSTLASKATAEDETKLDAK